MKWNRVKRLVMGSLVAVMLLFGAWPATTQAQVRVIRPHARVFIGPRPVFYPGWYGHPYYTVYDPIAYQKEEGYRDGLSRGKDDAKHGKADDPNSHKHYRDSSSITYREAFLQGYNDGYSRYEGQGR